MNPFYVHPDIALAQTISTEVYNSPQVFEMAKEKIFAAGWQWVGDTDMIAEQSSCHPFILLQNYLNEPLLLSKDLQGTIRCLSNVCTHRGNLLVTQNCKVANLRCAYHGRCNRGTLQLLHTWKIFCKP